MRTAARGAQTAKAMAEAVADAAAGGNHGEPGGVLKRMNRIAQWRKEYPDMIPLTPLIKSKVIAGIPSGSFKPSYDYGWAQLPSAKSRGFCIGMFLDRTHFVPLAFADAQGRVFVGSSAATGPSRLDPSLLFEKEHDQNVPVSWLNGTPQADDDMIAQAVVGGIYTMPMDSSSPVRVGTWIKWHDRYTITDIRPGIRLQNRCRLEYRDALTVAFIELSGLYSHRDPKPFGADNIVAHLAQEAPLAAIRAAAADIRDTRSDAGNVSGLDEYFVDIMNDVGALQPMSGLEARHGREPLETMQSSNSGRVYFLWHDDLTPAQCLSALRVEGTVNRFLAIDEALKINEQYGFLPTESTITKQQAAQLDFALLENPALSILSDPMREATRPGEIHSDPVVSLAPRARVKAVREYVLHPFPSADHAAQQDQDPDLDSLQTTGSEWVYRKVLVSLLHGIRTPFRHDLDFRSNLKNGCVAIEMTTAGDALMPTKRFDTGSDSWVEMSQGERIAMAVDYNLRMGMIIAAMAFGVDPTVTSVSVRLDSLGLEEAVREQSEAMTTLIAQLLGPLGDQGNAAHTPTGSRSDPKDMDSHASLRIDSDATGVAASQGASQTPLSGAAADSSPSQSAAASASAGAESSSETAASSMAEADSRSGGSTDSPSMGYALSVRSQDPAEGTDANADGGAEQMDSFSLLKPLVTVTFTREKFLDALKTRGLSDPLDLYRSFNARMAFDDNGRLVPIEPSFDIHSTKFAPAGAQEVPEMSDVPFTEDVAKILGCHDVTGLAIQRADLLQRAVTDFHRIASDDSTTSADKARHVMRIVDALGDPELTQMAPQVTSAIIDGHDLPDLPFHATRNLEAADEEARSHLEMGDAEGAIAVAEEAVARMDAFFATADGVPRYFNSYAERVVYNRLFAMHGEKVVLIPDKLFGLHMALANFIAQVKSPKDALPHMNMLVKYAPAYSTAHMLLATQMAVAQDWDSVYAASLNALRVSLARDDASYAYYRLAYAEWMRDRFDVAAACYLLSLQINPGQMPPAQQELQQLVANAVSQNIPVPRSVDQAVQVLRSEGIPVWPHMELTDIVRDAERVCVDMGLFIPGANLATASSRMNDTSVTRMGAEDWQFRQSLGA
jgi:tetratricopeptide (TPR) repeat protein